MRYYSCMLKLHMYINAVNQQSIKEFKALNDNERITRYIQLLLVFITLNYII